MADLKSLLYAGRNGKTILFCGAGLTADSLNFEDAATLGVTGNLLRLLNQELKTRGKEHRFRNIKNAAQTFRKELGHHALMTFLKDRFQLSNISATIADIARYPWSTIYTTNYDNGLELALQDIKRKYVSLNNLDEPNAPVNGTPIIHLHGSSQAWTDATFEQSCVLDADSYRELSGVSRWLERLRFDIERATAVIFVGFSAADVHLSNVFFNSTGLREKAFFINHPVAEPDIDERTAQEEFGLPLYIGREGLAQTLSEVLRLPAPEEPALASFRRYELPNASVSVPPVEDIEDLFIWGTVNPEHLKRDLDQSKSDYHVLRRDIGEVLDILANPAKTLLLYGDICDGKSIIIADAKNSLAGRRPIYELTHAYKDLLDEASSILTAHPNAVLVVENCFSIHEERLLGLARLVAGSEGNLILSARSVSTEGEYGKLNGLRSLPSFVDKQVGALRDSEIDAMIALIAQLAGWRDFRALSPAERRRFIERECKGSVPNVMLRLFDSEYVRNKYREEYQKTSHLNEQDRRMVIAALLISNIGFDAPLSFITDLFETDFVMALDRITRQSSGLRLVRVDGQRAKTIPSIGARNLLRTVIDDRDIVKTTIYMLEHLASQYRRTDFEQHVFAQLMRYSILNSIVKDKDYVNYFFDHISKIEYFRDMPLFWLQWHMAMSDQKAWLNADKYLGMGFTAADAYERKQRKKYNRKQLNDRRAKFLAARAVAEHRSGVELFRDLKEAMEITERLMHEEELTHHPYDTLLDIAKAFVSRGPTAIDVQKSLLSTQMARVRKIAQSRVGVVEGDQRDQAKTAMEQITGVLGG